MSAKIIPSKSAIETLLQHTHDGKKQSEIATLMGISRTTLTRWLMTGEFPEVRAAYKLAKQAYANDLAEDVIRQASAPLHENPKLANAEVQRRKLIVDTSKWVASKLLPKVYGDNLHIDHAHSGKIELSPLAQLRQLESKGPVVVDVTAKPEARKLSSASASASKVVVSEEDCF